VDPSGEVGDLLGEIANLLLDLIELFVAGVEQLGNALDRKGGAIPTGQRRGRIAERGIELGALAAERGRVGQEREEIEGRDAGKHDPKHGQDALRGVPAFASASSQHRGRGLPPSKFRPKNDVNMANTACPSVVPNMTPPLVPVNSPQEK